MAWDFSTDPEFERKLEWMRGFVREEVWPIEAIEDRLTQADLDRINAPLQAEVRQQRPVGRAPAARPRRPGLRPGQARAHERDPRHVDLRAARSSAARRPTRATARSSRSPARAEQKERWLEPLLAGELRSAFSMTEPEHARLRSDAAGDPRRARRGRLRARRAQVVHLERVDRRLPHRHGRHRPRRAAASARVDVHRAGRRAGRDDRPRRARRWSIRSERFGVLGGHSEILYEDVRLGADALLGGEGEGFLIAQKRLVPGRIHHCMRWLGMARRAYDAMCERALYRPVKHGLLQATRRPCRRGSPTPPPRCRPPG